MISETNTWERTQAELNLASVREDAEQIEKAGAALHAWLVAKPKDKPEALKRAFRRDFADGRADMDRLAHYKSLAASNGYLEDYGHDAVDRAWLEAQKWHEAHPLAGSWKAEDDEGKERVFISEGVTGLEAALEALGIDLRYNVRAAVPELRRDNGPWEEWNDRVEADLRDMIAGFYAFPRKNSKGFRAQRAWWSNANFKVVLDGLLKQREVDPFVEWLDRLDDWDGVLRLSTWLEELFDVKDNDPRLVRWVARTILTVPIARAWKPGLKHDEMPVLNGGQGIGKSTALSWLFPIKYRASWFSDDLRLSANSQARVEALQGVVMVEVAEMSGSTTAELESLKAFLSRTTDQVRLAYRRNPEVFPRRCGMVGTANGSHVLPNDPTGNRRFVVVKVGGKIAVERIRKFMDLNRDQLWAEAKAAVKAWETMHLPHELHAERDAMNEQFRSGDHMIEEAVRNWLASQQSEGIAEVTMAAVASGIGLTQHGDGGARVPFTETKRIARAMERAGYEPTRTRIDGHQVRVWRARR